MSTRELGILLLAFAIGGCAASSGARDMRSEGPATPTLGQPVSEAQIAGWDISILPDGSGLPAGRGTSVQGAPVYVQKCQACHGVGGAGQPNDRLVGGQGTLAGVSPVRTIGSYWPYSTTLFDYVRRAMPYLQPQSLTNDEVYALSAYLLHLNGLIGETDEMNAQTLPKVRMPNRDNFILMYPAKGR
jgi:S-disulfanyl-L-cysteine oxidoreductase SoxD